VELAWAYPDDVISGKEVKLKRPVAAREHARYMHPSMKKPRRKK